MFNFYGLLIVLGILAGTWVVDRLDNKLDAWSALPWVIIPAVIGARLYHIIDHWQYYSQFPKQILMVWQGGLGIFGGIIGGIVGLILFVQQLPIAFFSKPLRRKLIYLKSLKYPSFDSRQLKPWINLRKFLLSWLETLFKKTICQLFYKLKILPRFLDLAAIGLPLGQAIGRWGNWFNQELLPVALWESLADLIIFLALLISFKKLRSRSGIIFCLYLVLYGLVRFGLEFVRVDPWYMGKVMSGLMVIIGGCGLYKNWLR